jgi:hypothetical protein
MDFARVATLLNNDTRATAELIGLRVITRDTTPEPLEIYFHPTGVHTLYRWILFWKKNGRYLRMTERDQTHIAVKPKSCQEIGYFPRPIPRLVFKRTFTPSNKRQTSCKVNRGTKAQTTVLPREVICIQQRLTHNTTEYQDTYTTSVNPNNTLTPSIEVGTWHASGHPYVGPSMYHTFTTASDSSVQWRFDELGCFGAARFCGLVRWLGHQRSNLPQFCYESRLSHRREQPSRFFPLAPESLDVCRSTAFVVAFLLPFVPDALNWWLCIEQMLAFRVLVPSTEQESFGLLASGGVWISTSGRERHVRHSGSMTGFIELKVQSVERHKDPDTEALRQLGVYARGLLHLDNQDTFLSSWLYALVFALAHLDFIYRALVSSDHEQIERMRVSMAKLFVRTHWVEPTIHYVQRKIAAFHPGV